MDGVEQRTHAAKASKGTEVGRNSRLQRLLAAAYDPLKAPNISTIKDFLEWLGPLEERGVVAVLFYGSCLNPGMAESSSTPDFYVVVKGYGMFHQRRWVDRLLNRWLPPNIYRWRDSKYSVVSLADLRRETSKKARDVYHMGRFSKFLATAWVAGPPAQDALIECVAGAVAQVCRRATALLEERFTLDQLAFKALQISYLGEPRVEATDKVERIFASRRDFYRDVFSAALQHLVVHEKWLSAASGETTFVQQRDERYRRGVTRWMRRSRRRALWRWPKYIWTVRNWPSYIVAKIERTQGIRLELTERERRHPLIYGWKHLWLLKKNKMLK